MRRKNWLPQVFGLALGVVLHQTSWAGAAFNFNELAEQANQTKQKALVATAIPNVGATTSTRGCLGYSADQLRERALPYHDTIMLYSDRYGIDHNLIRSVIAIESCYTVKALSPKGAQGLMQLIPATAQRFGITDPNDSSQNIRGGARYLAWLIERFNGDVSKALAGYNAGEGAVDRYKGIPPYRETQAYVVNVLALYQRLANKTAPSVVAYATPALQEDLGGISTELTEVLRGGAKLPPIPETTLASATPLPEAPLTLPQVAAPQPAANRYAVANVAAFNANNLVRVAANKTLAPTRVDKNAEFASQVVNTLVKGGPPISRAQAQAAQQAKARANPALRVAQINPRPAANPNPVRPQRVSHTYATALSKPGRGGWEANRARAPGLYKVQ